MKKPAWEEMPVLDVRALTTEQCERLARTYDDVSRKDLQALAKLDDDPVRQQIDDAISETLGLSELSYLRKLMAREPGLSGKPILPQDAKANQP